MGNLQLHWQIDCVISDKAPLCNRFENRFESSPPCPINQSSWHYIRHQQVVIAPYHLRSVFEMRWSEIVEHVRKLVAHALIQRSSAYLEFRQRLPDILAYSTKITRTLQLCRQELSSAHNYNASALQGLCLALKTPCPVVSVQPQHFAAFMQQRFTQCSAKLSNESLQPSACPDAWNKRARPWNVFSGDELFGIFPDQPTPVHLTAQGAAAVSELEHLLKSCTLTPNGLNAGASELAQVFPAARWQLSSAAQAQNKASTMKLEAAAEADRLLLALLAAEPNYRTIWFKGWQLALRGETLGLLIATASSLLALDPHCSDRCVRYLQAFLQLQLAAAHSEPVSCYLLAWLCKKYWSPVHLDNCFAISESYYLRAANLGLDIALLELADMQERHDLEQQAYNYWMLAARQFHPLALREVIGLTCRTHSSMHGTAAGVGADDDNDEDWFDTKDFDLAWLLIVCYHLLQPQDLSIFCTVGIMLLSGQGVPIDKPLALEMFQSLVPANVDACYMLGIMYFNANGVDYDYGKSLYYFSLTAPHSIYDSNALLGYLYECGSGGPVDLELAERHYKLALRDKECKLQEYSAERLLHLQLKKLQRAIEHRQSDIENRLRTEIKRTLRISANQFPVHEQAWRQRLKEFEECPVLTQLSYFHG